MNICQLESGVAGELSAYGVQALSEGPVDYTN